MDSITEFNGPKGKKHAVAVHHHREVNLVVVMFMRPATPKEKKFFGQRPKKERRMDPIYLGEGGVLVTKVVLTIEAYKALKKAVTNKL